MRQSILLICGLVLLLWAGVAQARMIQAEDGRQLVQLRIDLGLLQLESTGRPDGARPHGHDTYCEYLRDQARLARRSEQTFHMSDEQCQDADREFLQYYHALDCPSRAHSRWAQDGFRAML